MMRLFIVIICTALFAGCSIADQKQKATGANATTDSIETAVIDSTPAGYKSIHQEQSEEHKNTEDRIK